MRRWSLQSPFRTNLQLLVHIVKGLVRSSRTQPQNCFGFYIERINI